MRLFLYCAFFLFSNSVYSQLNGNEIVGKWITEEENAIFDCYFSNGKYYAKVVWYKPFDEKIEGRKIDSKENTMYLNKIVMQDFVFDKTEWNNGRIIDLASNKTYTSYIKIIKPTQIKVTGYIFFRWLSQTITLKKI